MMKLDRNGTAPLHSQIHDFIRDRIITNKLKSDDHIPSERELAEELKVSRMTVRQAMNALREEGLIYQKQGKGTFVSGIKLDIHTRNLNGFSDEMRRRSMTPTSKVLGLSEEPAVKETAEKLELELGEAVFFIRRLRLADDIPMAVETTCLSATRFPGLADIDFQKISLYQFLTETYNVKMHSAAEDVEASISDAETSELLGVKKSSPLLIVYRTVFTEDSHPIEYTKSIYRADRYRASFYLVKK